MISERAITLHDTSISQMLTANIYRLKTRLFVKLIIKAFGAVDN